VKSGHCARERSGCQTGYRIRAALSYTVLLCSVAACGPTGTRAPSAPIGAPVPAAAGSVRLLRDSWGLPHIYAEREADGYYGLGYALAQDRLEQVLLTYRIIQGSSAEFFGPGARERTR